jgi:tRNA(Ile)-lysidine synthetase-like protein
MELEELYTYWFGNPDIWFGNSEQVDIELTEKYDKYILPKYNIEDILLNKSNSIGLIILYDQIVRHIGRVNPNSYSIELNNVKAIDISKQVYLIYKDLLNPDEFAFVMLPYRHSKKPENIFMVMNETWKHIEANQSNTNIVLKYKKFLKATYEKYITQTNDLANLVNYQVNNEVKSLDINSYSDVLDAKCLELMKDKTISYNSDQMLMDDLCYKFKQSFNNIQITCSTNPLVLSISGGVDSMVCSYILANAKVNFSCVHINYFNRKESMKEEEFVINWCKLLKIPLKVRRIEEINRPKCMEHGLRELYENYTRDIRYGSYLNSIVGLDIDSTATATCILDTNNIVNVMLGHNKDDCFENIITNIANKAKYENLNGMDEITKIPHKKSFINFVRPMLGINKAQIYEFAHKYDIPYLFDSTPKWAQRGKIRDVVRPTLNEFNSNLISGIFELQIVLSESLEMVELLVETWYDKIKVNLNKTSIDKKVALKQLSNSVNELSQLEIPIKNLIMSKIFWKKIFAKLDIKVSSKSLGEYLSKLQMIKNNFNQIETNKLLRYQINSEGQIKFMKLKSNNLVI